MLAVITRVCVYTANVSVRLCRICSPETVSPDNAVYHNSLFEPVHEVRSVCRTKMYKYFPNVEYFSRYETFRKGKALLE